jgi:hypothetical protein
MLHNPVVGRVCAVADENHAHIRHPWWPNGARAVRHDKNVELQTSRYAVGLLTHWARITIDVNVSQIFGPFVLGVSLPISHSPSFDHRLRLSVLPGPKYGRHVLAKNRTVSSITCYSALGERRERLQTILPTGSTTDPRAPRMGSAARTALITCL